MGVLEERHPEKGNGIKVAYDESDSENNIEETHGHKDLIGTLLGHHKSIQSGDGIQVIS